MHERSRVDVAQRYVIYALQLSLLLAGVGAVLAGRWTVLFVSVMVFVLSFLPQMIERRFHIDLPVELELLIVLFLFASLFLGEVHGYYTRFWWWDVLLHVGSAMAFGFTGFLIMYVLDRQSVIRARPFWIALFGFCFAVAIGAVWEIFEFGMDSFFGFDMQKSGLVDTMWDLIVDTVGALLVALAGYFYLRTDKGTLFRRWLERFFAHNPEIGVSE